jgi:hypothetical protein
MSASACSCPGDSFCVITGLDMLPDSMGYPTNVDVDCSCMSIEG